MTNLNAMKQISTRNVGYKIEIMQWNNKMDLIALSNDKGEVIVHRLKWKKLWVHPPPTENDKVRGLSWRPDEKLLAIGYNDGTVSLLDIENNEVIHTFNLECDISSICWTNNSTEFNLDDIDSNIYNNHKTYLSSLPNLNNISTSSKKQDISAFNFYSKKILNFLIIGLTNGTVYISVFGILPCGRINIANEIKNNQLFTIKDARMSYDFKQLLVTVEQDNTQVIFIYENKILPKYSGSLLNLAIKHGHILHTLTYINETIQNIIEAWETVLLEMDNKLTKYSSTQPDGAISADFLDLLMFGYPSESLEEFLTRDLTEKGLKKLGNSIELSYSTIQKLVVKHLHTAILNISYHLNTLQGMNENSYYYKPILGNISKDAFINAGSFLIKAYELQQTIDTSTRDYKIFFRWLYVAIIRLMEETVSDDIAIVSQQEILYLADFLNNFDQNSKTFEQLGETKRKFNLERVGQYLEDKNLSFPPLRDCDNLWTKLVEENDCLRKFTSIVFPHYKTLSLVQQHNMLKQSIDDIFKKPEAIIGVSFELKNIIKNTSDPNTEKLDTIYSSFVNIPEDKVSLICIMDSKNSLVFIESKENFMMKVVKLQFPVLPYFYCKMKNFGYLTFKHIQFYNENILSVLLNNAEDKKNSTCFLQFPVKLIRELMQEIDNSDKLNFQDLNNYMKVVQGLNAYEIIDENLIRTIEGMDGCKISVSGTRHVSAILSESSRIIRLYEMEVDDDEEDLEVSINSSIDTSKESVDVSH